MKHLSVLLTSLAVIAYNPVSAQTILSSNEALNLSSVKTSVEQNALARKKEVLEEEKKQEEQKQEEQKQRDAFVNENDKLNDANYVRKRIQELERALYNKTKKEVISDNKNTVSIGKTLPQEMQKELEKEYQLPD